MALLLFPQRILTGLHKTAYDLPMRIVLAPPVRHQGFPYSLEGMRGEKKERIFYPAMRTLLFQLTSQRCPKFFNVRDILPVQSANGI